MSLVQDPDLSFNVYSLFKFENLTQNLSIPNFEILSLNVDFLGYIRSNVWMFFRRDEGL